jgi:hypothetical protein
METRLIAIDRRDRAAGRSSGGGLSFVQSSLPIKAAMRRACESNSKPSAMFWPLLARTLVGAATQTVASESTLERTS